MKFGFQVLKALRIAAAVLLIFALPPTAWGEAKYKVLHDFGNGKDGTEPNGPLVFDSRGSLYGVTFGGGDGCVGGCGTMFKLRSLADGRWKESILHAFTAGSGGAFPDSALIFDSAENIYGTIGGYGSYAVGGVFELMPVSGGWDFSVLYSDGSGPGVLMDKLGNLYGEMGPGQYRGGAIGELSPGSDGWTYRPLHSFNGTDGLSPWAPPIWDGKGNMFGTTAEGGIYKAPCQTLYGCGVIYEMTPNGDGTWAYHVLHRFASFKNDGQSPFYSGLVMDNTGSFYGATAGGGRYGQGTLFKFAYEGGHWQETILYDFPNCNYGCGPEGTLALDKAGNLYGTAAGGSSVSCGGYTCGVVFKLSPQKNGKWKYSVVYNLTAEGGGFQPFYGVILDGKGHLFGVTSQFGKYGFGTAFEITQ